MRISAFTVHFFATKWPVTITRRALEEQFRRRVLVVPSLSKAPNANIEVQ